MILRLTSPQTSLWRRSRHAEGRGENPPCITANWAEIIKTWPKCWSLNIMLQRYHVDRCSIDQKHWSAFMSASIWSFLCSLLPSRTRRRGSDMQPQCQWAKSEDSFRVATVTHSRGALVMVALHDWGKIIDYPLLEKATAFIFVFGLWKTNNLC